MTIIHFEARAKERGASLAVAQPAASLSPYLSTLIAPYQRYLVGEGRRTEGVARYLWGLGRFLEWMPDGATVADVDGPRCQEYKEYLANDRRAAPATIINALAILRDFARFCVAKGYRGDDPTADVKRPKKVRPRAKPLHPHEVEALIAAIRIPERLPAQRRWRWERDRRLVYLLIYTGLRLKEAAGLCWRDVSLEAGVIVVPIGTAKGGKERAIEIHPRLKAILESVPEAERQDDQAVAGRSDGHCLTDSGMAKIFSRWLKDELGIQKVHPHRLRHSFACLMLWNGADIRTIQELLGHAQLATTEWYLEVLDEQRRSAIGRIPDFGG
jgi:integrase/recombinase XerD